VSRRETRWLHWCYKTQTNSLIFLECKTQTSTVNKRLHSVLDKSEVSEEDSQFLLLKSLKSTLKRDLERWLKKKSRLSTTSSPDQLSTTSQNGSLTGKRTQEMALTPNLSQTVSIPWWERILRDSESARITEVSDMLGVSELEVKEPSPPVDAEELLVLPERSETVYSFGEQLVFVDFTYSANVWVESVCWPLIKNNNYHAFLSEENALFCFL